MRSPIPAVALLIYGMCLAPSLGAQPQRTNASADHPDATWSPSPKPYQVRADRCLIDKHQPGGIKHALLSYPTSARSRHICALPVGSLQAFF